MVGQLFDALKAVGISGRVTGRDPDFHGDGRYCEIDVTLPYGELRHNSFQPLSECDLEIAFKGPDFAEALLACKSAALDWTVASQSSGLAISSSGPSAVPKEAGYGIATSVDLVRYLLAARTFFVESNDHFRIESISDGSGLSVMRCSTCGGRIPYNPSLAENSINGVKAVAKSICDGVGASSGQVFLDHIVDIMMEHRSTHVYNLSTVEGYFLSGGFYTKNTTRAYGSGTLAAGIEQSRVTGRLLRKRWVTEHDSRVRETHREVNGDVRDLWSPFMVGDVPLMFPGDPFGPADEICGCRCDLVIMNEKR
jgi:hypothetical protein